MQSRISTPQGVAILIVALLVVGLVYWGMQPAKTSTDEHGIPRTDTITADQKAGMDIMNRAGRPDLQQPPR